VVMTENVRKLVGVAAMAVLVVVGIAVSSGDDTDFTRNTSFRGATSPSASADKAADCCDETLALLESMQDQLQTLLDAESEPAYVQLLEDQCSYTSPYQSMGLTSIKVWDCSGAQFAYADFRGAQLVGVDFSGANLDRANFAGANLTGSTITNASLNGANFRAAMLSSADFSGSMMHHTNFSGAMLRLADFIGANATGADFSNANLTFSDFTDASLNYANFGGANLRFADFTDASFNKINFTGAIIDWVKGDLPSPGEDAKIHNE
jgi:uncharacterized protein YjbI with pentapeptide repeats